MLGLSKKQIIYLSITFGLLIIIAIILTIKPWIVKPKSVKAVEVGNTKIYTPALSPDEQTIYYYDLTQLNLFKINLKTNQKTQLSKNMVDIPDSLTWSPDRANVIIRIFYDKKKFEQEKSIFANSSIEDGSNTVWNYNIATSKLAQLKSDLANSTMSPEIINPIWTNDSKKIIYYYNDSTTNKYKFSIANFDGSAEQNIGSVPDDIFIILSYDSSKKIVYYSTQVNGETGVCQVYKYNITTGKKDLLADGEVDSASIDDHQFIISDNSKSTLYNTTDNTNKLLPIMTNAEQTAINPAKTVLLAGMISGYKEEFYIIDLENLKIVKKLDPGVENTGYSNLSLDSKSNIFFINSNSLYKIGY